MAPCRKPRNGNINQSVDVGSRTCREAEGQGVSQPLLMVQLPRPRRQDRKRGGQLGPHPPTPTPHRPLPQGIPGGACRLVRAPPRLQGAAALELSRALVSSLVLCCQARDPSRPPSPGG